MKFASVNPEIRFWDLFEQYQKKDEKEKEEKSKMRDQLLDLIPHLPYPGSALDLVKQFGAEAIYARLNQLHKDQMARQGYSDFSDLIGLYGKLEAIADTNKGTSPKIDAGQILGFSGQFVHKESDLVLESRGLDFEFERVYKSQVVYAGPLGANWDHNYNLWLRVEDGGIRVVRSTGDLREDTYEWDETEQVYLIPNGFTSKLYRDTILLAGIGDFINRYVLETLDGTRFIYLEIPDGLGMHKVEYILDRYGNFIQFKYDENHTGLLETITDTLGKKVEFFYDDHDRIIQIRERDRSAYYGYDENNNLVCVQKPAPKEFQEVPVTRYEYASFDYPGAFIHHLTAIIDAESNKYLENEYGLTEGLTEYAKVVRQRKGRGETLYQYEELDGTATDETDELRIPRFKTIIKRRNGQVVEEIYNREGNMLQLLECITGLSEVLAPAVTSFRYNKDGNMVWKEDPEGNVIQYVYYRDWFSLTNQEKSSLEERRKFGNLLKVIQQRKHSQTVLTVSPPFIDPKDIVFEFEYENLYHQISKQKDPRNPAWFTQYVYSSNPDSEITDDYEGIYLRRIQHSGATLPNGQTQEIIDEYDYNSFGQLKAGRSFRRTFNQDGHVVVTPVPVETTTQYYYFGEPLTDEPAVVDDPDKQGYIRLVKSDAGQDTPDRKYHNIRALFDVDRLGNIVSATDSKGNTTSYRYDPMGRRIEFSLPLHNISQQTFYNKNGRVVRTEQVNKDERGDPKTPESKLIAEFIYDCMDNLLEERTGVGSILGAKKIAHTYTPADQPLESVDPKGNKMRNQFNERGQLIAATQGLGTAEAVTLKYRYDILGRVIRMTDGEGNSVNIEYDEFSRVIKQIDPLGHYVTYSYDKIGNILEKNIWDNQQTLLNRTAYRYDELSRLIERLNYWFTPGDENNVKIIKTQFYFDEENNIICAIEDADGIQQKSNFEYNALNRLVRAVDNAGNEILNFYDDNGNLIQLTEIEKNEDGTIQEVFVTQNSFDALNRLISTTDNLGNTTHHWYDSQDNVVKVEDALKNVVRTEYDLFSRAVTEIAEMKEGGEVKTEYHYDANDLLTKIVDDKGNPTAYQYDSLNRQTEVRYATGDAEKYQYNRNSKPVVIRDCNGLVKKYTYDPRGLMTKVELDKSKVPGNIQVLGSSFEHFTYDASGNLVTAQNDFSTVNLGYDSFDNLLFEETNGKRTQSQYNALGVRTGITYPSGRKLDIRLDRLGRIQEISNLDLGNNYPGKANAAALLLKDAFLGPNRLLKRWFGNGLTTDYTYDAGKRPTSIKYTHPDNQVLEIQCLFDGIGNKSFENKLKATAREGQQYHYDSLYRLTATKYTADIPVVPVADFKAASSKNQPNKPQQLAIDAYLKNIAPQLVQKSFAYEYDTLGNRVKKSETGKPDVAYQTNALNQYTAVDGQALEYDLNGNLLKDDQFRYFYDFENKLVKVEYLTGALVADYVYDALGRRIQKHLGDGSQINFVHDGINIIEERIAGDQIVAQYVFGDEVDEIIQMARGQEDYFYLTNSLGSIIALSNSQSNLVEEYTYSPYGEVSGNLLTGNPYFFTGRQLDAETGLMYYRSRYYSPRLGRFLQQDPKGYVDGMNRMEYVKSNPVNGGDPFGEKQVIWSRRPPGYDVYVLLITVNTITTSNGNTKTVHTETLKYYFYMDRKRNNFAHTGTVHPEVTKSNTEKQARIVGPVEGVQSGKYFKLIFNIEGHTEVKTSTIKSTSVTTIPKFIKWVIEPQVQYNSTGGKVGRFEYTPETKHTTDSESTQTTKLNRPLSRNITIEVGKSGGATILPAKNIAIFEGSTATERQEASFEAKVMTESEYTTLQRNAEIARNTKILRNLQSSYRTLNNTLKGLKGELKNVEVLSRLNVVSWDEDIDAFFGMRSLNYASKSNETLKEKLKLRAEIAKTQESMAALMKDIERIKNRIP